MTKGCRRGLGRASGRNKHVDSPEFDRISGSFAFNAKSGSGGSRMDMRCWALVGLLAFAASGLRPACRANCRAVSSRRVGKGSPRSPLSSGPRSWLCSAYWPHPNQHRPHRTRRRPGLQARYQARWQAGAAATEAHSVVGKVTTSVEPSPWPIWESAKKTRPPGLARSSSSSTKPAQ